MSPVVDLLKRFGPSLSGTLGERLIASGMTPAAARQRLSRLPEQVLVLKGISFPKRARFLYLESQFGNRAYWPALIKAVNETNPAYAAAIAGVQARGGVVPLRHFDIVSGAPVLQSKQLASRAILDRLIAVGLMEKFESMGEEYVSLRHGSVTPEAQSVAMRPRLATEAVLIAAIRDWCGRMNMASPQATSIRDDDPEPQFATFKFDLCGPSYLRPLTKFKDGKLNPGFLVADVVCGMTFDETAVIPFIRKCDTLAHLRGIRPFMPILIADSFSPEALRACRSRGIITTRPATIFGADVAAAFTDLLQTLSNAAAQAAVNPDRLESLFRRLSGIEGAAANLRGALFELIIGHLVRELVGGSIDMGFTIRAPQSNESAEVDIRLVKGREVFIYECKGYQPGSVISEEEIKDWLERRVPRINGHHRHEDRFHSHSLTFEFWTCGTFSPEAKALLEKSSARTAKYSIAWKDGAAIQEFAKGLDKPGIRDVLNQHYFQHPIATFRRQKPSGAVSAPSEAPQWVTGEALDG